MKKFASILLCVLLLLSSLTLTAFADNVIYGDTDDELAYQIPDTELWESGKSYIIKSGCTFVVPSGRTLNVPLDSSLTVEEGAHFVVNGQLNVSGEMFVYGKLTGTDITGSGIIKCAVRFPALADPNNNLKDKIEVRYYASGSDDYYSDVNVPVEGTNKEGKGYTVVPADGAEVMVAYNTYIYVRVVVKEAVGEDRYDDKLYPVFHNNSRVSFAQNACPILVTTAGDISYGSWKTDNSYYNSYKITLPEGEGYTVYGRNGEYGEITLKYGQSFSFRVELEEEYNKSAYVVYVYNGSGWTNLEKDDLLEGIEPAVPDSEGYYTINSITGEYSIFVEGIMSNEVMGIFAQIFNIFQQIWKAIMDIFESFGMGDLLAGLGQ